MNILYWLDRGGNVIQEGDSRETISSTLGKGQKAGDPKFFNSVVAGRALVWILDKIQVDHCYRSIDNNAGSEAVYPQKDGKNV
jgi:hypothetical protein